MGTLRTMKRNASAKTVAWTALALGFGMAGSAVAQETPAQARARATTQSLNAAPAESTLGSTPPGAPLPRATAPVRPQTPARPTAPASRDPVAELLGRLGDADEPAATASVAPAPVPAPAAAAAAATSPAPVVVAAVPTGPPSAFAPLPIGYYVRGDKNCNQVWPLAGDLAWLSELTFTIDGGGCEAGEIEQTSDTTWSERQTCQTELGGEGPPYIIDYEAGPDGVLLTRARLGENALGVQDRWKPCDADEVPAEARFHADDPGRAAPQVDEDPDADA